MKGSEILERFEKAKQVIAKKSGSLGEIGDFLRYNGYLVYRDGFSVCSFGEYDIKLRFSADCCDRPWSIWNRLYIGDKVDGELLVAEIDPEADYDMPPNLSRTEMLEQGLIKPKAFRVLDVGGSYADRVRGEFGTLEKADEQARHLCQKEIDRLRKDNNLRPYTPTSVRNDAHQAKERGELRHYLDYCYQGHEYWFAVVDVS